MVLIMCNICYGHGIYQATGKNGELKPKPCPSCGEMADISKPVPMRLRGKKPVIFVAIIKGGNK